MEPTFKWVPQEHKWGCVPASLAMVTNRTYSDVVDDLGIDPSEEGISSYVWEQYLAERGYALARIHRYYNNVERNPWPPKPFAKVHLCEVIVSETSPGSHLVVMLGGGIVIDPLQPRPTELSAYHRVNNVSAVVPFRRHRSIYSVGATLATPALSPPHVETP